MAFHGFLRMATSREPLWQSHGNKAKDQGMKLNGIHHVAVICSDYERSLKFYTEVLGMTVMAERYREARQSHKTDLALGGKYCIELFSFPSPPPRPSYPEAAGLRHLAFATDDLDACIRHLEGCGVEHEPVRTDEYTRKRFVFFADPDGLPIELYEA